MSKRWRAVLPMPVPSHTAVAAVLETQVTDSKRFQIAGKADQQPVADNKTPDGRALNRRVDVSLERTGD